MTSDRGSPTVIVSRRVTTDNEDAFGVWVTRLITAAYRTPGYVSAGVERPDASHPGEWLVVYRFEDGDSLDGWLSSATRQALLREGEALVEGEAREQIVAGVPAHDEVRVVSSYQLRDGAHAEHLLFHQRVLDQLRGFPGFIGREILDAVEGVQSETVVMLTFDSRSNLVGWMESSERKAALAELETLTVGELTTTVVGGFAGWFPPAEGAGPTPKWKQAIVVLIALYPTVILTTQLGRWFWPDLNTYVAIFVGNVISIAILTWILMPALTHRLRSWLRGP
jgi:antibiotic biosynthesis monooxygenase (ABM) superfamily enzyme